MRISDWSSDVCSSDLTDLMYVAIPVASGGTVHGAVRVTYPTSTLDARVQETWLRLGLLSIVVLAIVAGVGMVFARGVTRPRSEERRAGKEGDSTCRSRWASYH